MAAEQAVQRGLHVFYHQEKGDEPGDAEEKLRPFKARMLEADPFFLYKSRHGERDQQADIAAAVVHHLLGVHKQLAVHIVHGIGLQSDINDPEPADDEADYKKDVFLLRVLFNIGKQLGGNKQPQG